MIQSGLAIAGILQMKRDKTDAQAVQGQRRPRCVKDACTLLNDLPLVDYEFQNLGDRRKSSEVGSQLLCTLMNERSRVYGAVLRLPLRETLKSFDGFPLETGRPFV